MDEKQAKYVGSCEGMRKKKCLKKKKKLLMEKKGTSQDSSVDSLALRKGGAEAFQTVGLELWRRCKNAAERCMMPILSLLN